MSDRTPRIFFDRGLPGLTPGIAPQPRHPDMGGGATYGHVASLLDRPEVAALRDFAERVAGATFPDLESAIADAQDLLIKLYGGDRSDKEEPE